jgi:hypothetical protein
MNSTQAAKQTTSMTPRSSVENNIKINMPSSPDANEQMDMKARDVAADDNNNDDGFNEFLKVIKSDSSGPKPPTESMATIVSSFDTSQIDPSLTI